MPTAAEMLNGPRPDGAASSLLSGPRDEKGDEAKRRRLFRRWIELDAIYRTWSTTHQDIVTFMCPNRGEFNQFEVNRGDRKDGEIVNNTATESGFKLVAAMDTGITSEAREWFTLSPEDPDVAENDGVREYCHTCQSILFGMIAKSSFYPANRNLLEDLVFPAIGLMLIEEDTTDVFRCEHVPIGQYRLAADSRGRVNTVIRMFTLTARQIAAEFGEENCSIAVQMALANETQEVPFRVLHFIEERQLRVAGKIDAKNKPWASVWMEIGAGTWNAAVPGSGEISASSTPSKILRESGYDEQPFIAPRWKSIGTDAYGKDSPGWVSLGDTKSLQALEMSSADAIAKIIMPPMNQPSDLANASLLPGALNPLAANSPQKFEPAVVVKPETVTVISDEKRIFEQRIDRGFYGDVLFLLSRDQSAQPKTAEEIRGKLMERLLQLGGVFGRYADEALKRAVRRFFMMAQRAGKFPPPPMELLKSGTLKIDFQNPLVTAQKTLGFTAMQQLVAFAIALSQARTAGVDKLDGDECLDTAAEMLGTKPNLLKSDDQLAQERQALAQQQKAQQMAASLPQSAGAISDLSNADPEKIRGLLSQLTPNAQTQGTA